MTDAPADSPFAHVFRPALLRRRRAYWLDGDVLRWRIGAREGQLSLRDIASVRLQLFGPAERCVVVEKTGRTHALTDHHWLGWWRMERRVASFRALAFALARRVKEVAPEAAMISGPSRAEWISSWIMGAAAAGLVFVGVGLMVAHRRFDPAAAIFVGMAVTTLPLLVPVLRSGGPKPLDIARLQDGAPPTG